MKKKHKKGKHRGESLLDDQSDVDNVDSATKRTKTRLRRRRERSNALSDSNSSDERGSGKKQKRKRRRKKRSRTATGTTEESSDWDEGSLARRESRVTTEEEKSKEKPKEVTEKQLVEKMQKMIPYLPSDSNLWTKWTLAPLYHFLRKPDSKLIVAFLIKKQGLVENSVSKQKRSSGITDSVPIPKTVERLMKLYELEDSYSENESVLVTFNEPIPEYTGEFFYFVKSAEAKIAAENFDNVVLFGNSPSSQVDALNSILRYLWTPILLEEDCLSDGMRDDVLRKVNDVSCTAQSITHFMATNEVLLSFSQEALLLEKSNNELSNDKEFCNRVEETVIHWISKLKELVVLKELDDIEDWPGPLEELSFWQNRSQNLIQVLKQLKSPVVKSLLHILFLSRSPYILHFRSLIDEIGEAHREASSNAHYLTMISEPCGRLLRGKFSEVKATLQKLLWVVLVLKRNAPFYNTAKRSNGILRKVSNMLIIICRNKVKIEQILEGKLIIKSERLIKSCLKCLNWWKEVYSSTEKVFSEKEGAESWNFDYDVIFVHVDAMIARLNDVLEICHVQKLFGRRLDDSGQAAALPLYPGLKGPLITRTMEKNQLELELFLENLQEKSELILDVKNPEWLDQMKDFRAFVVSIEMSIQNLIEEVFGQLPNLKQRVELLQQFYEFYSRDIIMRQIDKLAIQLYEYFEQEILNLKALFEHKVVPLPKTYSQMAGRGAWAIYMKRRIESHLDVLKAADSWLPKSVFGDCVKFEAKSLVDSMAAFSHKTYEDWANSKDVLDGEDINAKLDIPLLVRAGRDKKDVIEINFDRNLFRALTEAEIWSRVGRSVPVLLLMSVYTYRERLHSVREIVTRVAKIYNGVVSGLSRDERLLFKDRLLPLEKKIYPCLTTYTWSFEIATDHIVLDEFEKIAAEIRANIEAYRETNSKVSEIIFKMSERLMVDISPGQIYEPHNFHSKQNDLITKRLKRIVKNYQSIAQLLRELFKVFHADGPEVKVQWGKYVKLVDDCVEEALCLSLQKSLLLLETAMNSGSKQLFQLELKLQDKKVSFHPSLEQLAKLIFGVQDNIALALEPLSKISRYLEGPFSSQQKKTDRAFTTALLRDPVSLKIQQRMKFVIERTFSELNLYSERWIPYRDIWEVSKEEFMLNYSEKYSSLEAVEKDMAKYMEMSEVICGSENDVNIRFLRVNCSEIKQQISEECNVWFQLIAENLYKKAKDTIQDLYKYMESSRRKFEEVPQTLDDQLNMFQSLETVILESKRKTALFPVLSQQFSILVKAKFELEPVVNELNLKLEKEWKSFQSYLKESNKKLEKSYDQLKNAFLSCEENLKGKIAELIKSFEKSGPFSRDFQKENASSPENYWEEALIKLENFFNDLKVLKEEDLKLISSLMFFNINKLEDTNLINLQDEIISLSMIWGHVKQWEMQWNEWKSIQIENLQLQSVDQVSTNYLDLFKKLEKQFEIKSWPVISETRDFVLIVHECLRAIEFLTCDTLKTRNWDRIKSFLGNTCIPDNVTRAGELTLEMVVQLKLQRFVQQLSTLSLSSGKETLLANSLQTIEEYWNNEEFILRERQSLARFEICCGTHLKQQLMDHLVTISSMKGSSFIWPFKDKVTFWGALLTKIDEVLTHLLATQKEWMFLETLFLNEYITNEFPTLVKHFNGLSVTWSSIVFLISKEKNVANVIGKTEKLQEMLEDIDKDMEAIRKEVQVIIRDTRQEFPKLYFIEDHELLELIATSSQDPLKCLPIIRKLFGNLHQLQLSPNKLDNNFEILGISAKNEESLRFAQPVRILEPLHSWLANLETRIKLTISEKLGQCTQDLRRHSSTSLLDYILQTSCLSQCALTAVHIQWTNDVTKAIYLRSSEDRDGKNKASHPSLKRIQKQLRKNIQKISEILHRPKMRESAVTGTVTNLQRMKMEELLIKLVYLRELTERLQSCKEYLNPDSFEWIQCIRFYLEDKSLVAHEYGYGMIALRQCFARIEYGYEFVGFGQKFVITPIVERCFLSLTTAISFNYGAFIEGLPDVGKKETIRNLGQLLGKHMVNINLSEQTEWNNITRAILGIVQTGSWLTFTNMENCPNQLVPLLSDKLALITNVKSKNFGKIMLDGMEVNMNKSCEVFAIKIHNQRNVTTNACGSFIPLRAVTRPVALIQPDAQNILDTHLFIGGFENSANISTKLVKLFSTAKDSIGHNNRCNFTLTGMIAVVKKALEFKTIFKKRLNETEAIVKALKTTAMTSLDKQEQMEFGNLITCHFSSEEIPRLENVKLEEAIRNSVKALGYEHSDTLINQSIKLHELTQTFRLVIQVGNTSTGKSVARKVLKNALNQIHGNEQHIQEIVISTSTHESSELLGSRDSTVGKWNVGILTNVLKFFKLDPEGKVKIQDASASQFWIILDGPLCQNIVDGRWTEILQLDDRVRIIIETDDLSATTPNLISQSGVLYFEDNLTIWKSTLQTWINSITNFKWKSELSKSIQIIEKCLHFSSDNCISYLRNDYMTASAANTVFMFSHLMESFFIDLGYLEKKLEGLEKNFNLVLKQVLFFSIAWSVFGIHTEESQLKASAFLKDFEGNVFPTKGTVFDYFMDFESQKWFKWSKPLLKEMTYSEHEYEYTVPTDSTERSKYFISRLEDLCPTLVMGYSNSGKTNIIKSTLRQVYIERKAKFLHIQMTHRMTGESVQSLIASRLEKVSPSQLSPTPGKRLTIFIDDLHAFSSHFLLKAGESQLSPVEPNTPSSYTDFLRHFIEQRMWFDKAKRLPTTVSNVSLVCAMTLNPSRSVHLIPPRLQSKFSLVYVPPPDEYQLRKIFTIKLTGKLNDFVPAVKLLADLITVATLDIYKIISAEFQPTPSQPLHIFSIYDISKVYDGLLRANKGVQDTKQGILRLWFHECYRTFHDKFMDECSREKCEAIFAEQLLKHFEMPVATLLPQGMPLFGNFLRSTKGVSIYEELKDEVELHQLLVKAQEKGKFEKENLLGGGVVLFKAAISQIVRIARLLSVSAGHVINCGKGGQGRQTLSKLAAAVLGLEVFDAGQHYGEKETPQDCKNFGKVLKQLLNNIYQRCAVGSTGCCLIITGELVSEETLELLCLATSTVEIPELFNQTELQNIIEKTKTRLQSTDARLEEYRKNEILDVIKTTIEQNFHVVLCIDPGKNEIRALSRYPSLLKQMTANWFEIWEKASYIEVANAFLKGVEVKEDWIKSQISCGSVFHRFHTAAEDVSLRYMEDGLSSFCTITPIHFLHFLQTFNSRVSETVAFAQGRLILFQEAIQEIDKVRAKIGFLSDKTANAEKKLNASKDECEKLHEIVEAQEAATNKQQKIFTEMSLHLDAELKDFHELAENIKTEWSEALSEFEDTVNCLQDLSIDDLTHIRSYHSPPQTVSRVLDAVMVMLDKDQTWPEAKIQLAHPDFITKITEFDKGSITMEKLNKLRKFTPNPEFTAEAAGKHSNGARILCIWIHAIEKYGRAYLTKIAPKREKLDETDQSIIERRHELELNSQKLDLLKENLSEHQTNYETKLQLKESHEEDFNHWNGLHFRALNILRLLNEDELKWKNEMGNLETSLETVMSTSLLAAAVLAYLGPFDTICRKIIRQRWAAELNSTDLLVKAQRDLNWRIDEVIQIPSETLKLTLIKQLPYETKDLHLGENMLSLMTNRKLIIVDPDSISQQLMSSDIQMVDVVPKIIPIGENTGPCGTLNLYKESVQRFIIGSNSVSSNQKNQNVALLSNDPKLTIGWEIASNFLLVNFSLSVEGLEQHLANEIWAAIDENAKPKFNHFLQELMEHEQYMIAFVSRIPKFVINSGETILDNNEFPETLIKWKGEFVEVKSKRDKLHDEFYQLELKRQNFRAIAVKLLKLYLTLNELAHTAPLYTMSLHFFLKLVKNIIRKFQMAGQSEVNGKASPRKSSREVLEYLNTDGYKMLIWEIGQMLRAKDRQLFALLFCMTDAKNGEKRGFDELCCLFEIDRCVNNNAVIDYDQTEVEKIHFLSNQQLSSLRLIEHIEHFQDLLSNILEDCSTWNNWMQFPQPEDAFPSSCSKYGPIEKFVVLAILRPDRIPSQLRSLTEDLCNPEEFHDFLSSNAPLNLSVIYRSIESLNDLSFTPVIFCLDDRFGITPNPQVAIQTLANSLTFYPKLYSLSTLPQNIQLARKLIREGMDQGFWVFFPNCHLAPEWMTELEQMLRNINRDEIHDNFQLWISLSSSCVDGSFPKGLPRNSVKIMIEASHNLEIDVTRLMRKLTNCAEEVKDGNSATLNHLLYGLTTLHARLNCRHKYEQRSSIGVDESILQDIDFEISTAILKTFSKKYSSEHFPWWGIRKMLELQYGNRFRTNTDTQSEPHYHDYLFQLLKTMFCEELISRPSFGRLLFRISSSDDDPTTYLHTVESQATNVEDDDHNWELYGIEDRVGRSFNASLGKQILHAMREIFARIIIRRQWLNKTEN